MGIWQRNKQTICASYMQVRTNAHWWKIFSESYLILYILSKKIKFTRNGSTFFFALFGTRQVGLLCLLWFIMFIKHFMNWILIKSWRLFHFCLWSTKCFNLFVHIYITDVVACIASCRASIQGLNLQKKKKFKPFRSI